MIPDKETIGGGWNIVFVGTTGAPPTDYPKGGEEHRAITNIANSPVVAEKPYISIGANGTYNLQIPPVKWRSVGTSLNSAVGLRFVPFVDVFVTKWDEHDLYSNCTRPKKKKKPDIRDEHERVLQSV